MTVKELIEELQKMPRNMQVHCELDDGYFPSVIEKAALVDYRFRQKDEHVKMVILGNK